MLPQTKSFRMPHACDMRYFLFHAAFIICTGIKEGDIVIMGSDGVFDNLYLVARCCEMLVVILPHAALFQWWHLTAFHFFQLWTMSLKNLCGFIHYYTLTNAGSSSPASRFIFIPGRSHCHCKFCAASFISDTATCHSLKVAHLLACESDNHTCAHTYTYQIIQQYARYSIQESRSHNYWSGKEVSLVNRSKLGAVVAAADRSKLRGDHCNHHFWPTYRNGLWRQKMAEAEPEKSVRHVPIFWQFILYKVEKLLANFIKFQDATGACCYRDGRTKLRSYPDWYRTAAWYAKWC